MTQTVTVLSVSGNGAKVFYDRPTACHGDCSKCAGGCGSMAAREHIVVEADNLIGAKPGDRVILDGQTGKVATAIVLVYVLPLVLFFLGYAVGALLKTGEVLFGGLGFFLGLATAVAVSRRQKRTGTQIRFQIVAYEQ